MRVVVEVGGSPATDGRRAGSEAAKSSVVVDFVKTSITDLLRVNAPYLCCIRSVCRRAFLGSVLVDALVAYENGGIPEMMTFL